MEFSAYFNADAYLEITDNIVHEGFDWRPKFTLKANFSYAPYEFIRIQSRESDRKEYGTLRIRKLRGVKESKLNIPQPSSVVFFIISSDLACLLCNATKILRDVVDKVAEFSLLNGYEEPSSRWRPFRKREEILIIN